MAFNDIPIDTLKRKIDEVKRFLSISLSISNAHTVDFYTRDVWSTFMCASPEEVLCAVSSIQDHMGAIEGESSDEVLAPDEFMNRKKANEVQAVSEVVVCLAKCCRVKQVTDVGSGKGYLCSYLSMRFDLQVLGIDSSSTNTHGAQERNRKLKKLSKAYQKFNKTSRKQRLNSEDESKQHSINFENSDGNKNFITEEKESFEAQAKTSALSKQVTKDLSASDNAAECPLDPNDSDQQLLQYAVSGRHRGCLSPRPPQPAEPGGKGEKEERKS